MRRRRDGDRRGPGRRARRCGALIAGALALLAVGCTTGEPEEPVPAPEIPEDDEDAVNAVAVGTRVEVVLPAAGELDDAVAAGLSARLRALAAELPEGIGSLRVHVPDSEPFVADLTELLAARGHELVCVVGADSASVAEPVAERHRGTTLCALPAAPPDPEGESLVLPPTPATRIDLPVEELGVLAGTAARVAAEARAEAEAEQARAEAEAAADAGDDDAPPEPLPSIVAEPPMVGLVLGGDELPADRFREGLLHGLVGAEVVEAEDLSTSPVEQLEAVLAAGAHVVLIDGAPGAADVVAALDGRAGIVAPTDVAAAVTADGGLPRELVLSYRLRLEVGLREVISRFSEQGLLLSPIVLPLSDDLLSLEPGPAGQGAAAALEVARQELTAEPTPDTAPPDGAGGDVPG